MVTITAPQLALDIPTPPIHRGRCFRSDAVGPARLSRPRLAAGLAEGTLREVVRGVYVDARAPDDPATWLAALRLLVPPGAVVARQSAAWVHGVDVRSTGPPGDVPQVECLVPYGTSVRRRSGLRCRSAPLEQADVDGLGGVRCTTPLRTAADLLTHLPRHMALAAADAMAHAGLFTRGQLVAEVRRRQGRRGYRHARRLASFCDAGAESFAESWTRLRLLDAGFPRPVTQVPLGRDGWVEYRIDLGYPRLRVGIEYDGMAYHSTGADRRRDDKRRDRIRREYGWTLLVADHGDILGRQLAFERAVGEALGMEPTIRWRRW
jgi:hypothetical protein